MALADVDGVQAAGDDDLLGRVPWRATSRTSAPVPPCRVVGRRVEQQRFGGIVVDMRTAAHRWPARRARRGCRAPPTFRTTARRRARHRRAILAMVSGVSLTKTPTFQTSAGIFSAIMAAPVGEM